MALIDASDLDSFVDALSGDPRLIHLERLAARPARFAELDQPLPAIVRERLGVERFWSHQAEAIDLARTGRSVAIATGTASGKSLCYQAPIAESIVEGLRPATALLVFPTKALAQDQLRALSAMDVPKLVACTYDGDSGPEERTWVRSHGNVVLTNPEMLHHGILPHHARWSTYLMRLRYVVVDELHLLRGIFGSHVAHLLRRLRRLCARYGSSPTFIFSSATIGRPEVLASELCGLDVAAVIGDGSPRGERLFALWNPSATHPPWRPGATTEGLSLVRGGFELTGPFSLDAPAALHAPVATDGGPPGDGASTDRARHVSANRETAALVAALVRDGRRTIAFCRSRQGTEVVAAETARRLPRELAQRVRPYRAGYLTAERRDIEAELFTGRLLAVVATTALELGVDIGGLDACVLNGFPGTMASLWQQAGRAGRGTRQSIAILVAGDDQLDQWLVAHPDEIFTRPAEAAVINIANPFVLYPHLACAAYEQPLGHADEQWWPELLDDGVRELVLGDHLKLRGRGRGSMREPIAVWAGRGWPSHNVGLRGGSTDEVRIALADGTLVGTTDRGRACRMVHPGAVYLHRGQAYRVSELDLDDGAAIVAPFDGGEHTRPRTETEISILDTDVTRPVGRSALALGTVQVVSRVIGYRRIDTYTGEVLANEELFLPPSELITRSFWYTVAPEVLAAAGIAPASWPGTLHAVEHAGIGMMPLFAICDRWDVGGVSIARHHDTGLPTIFIHDAYAGGAGVAELGFEVADRHLAATRDVIASCGCDIGCPSCVQSPKCGNGNEPLDKVGALALLRTILGPDRVFGGTSPAVPTSP
jgi:DEAD/DEAH box helicase domain-containing protein